MFRTAHAALPHVIERKGYVLIVSSLAAFTSPPGLSAYCASKWGAEALANCMRHEVGFRGVKVASCHPSWIDTDLVRDAEHDLPSFKQMRSHLPWPAHKTTTVEECALTIADGIAKRKRKIRVPREIAVMDWTRVLANGPLADIALRFEAKRLMPQMEAEIEALGRQFSRAHRGAQQDRRLGSLAYASADGCTRRAGPTALVLEEIDEPAAVDGLVLVDVAAAGVGFFDLLVTKGEYQIKPELPCAPATECVGVRRDTGERVVATAMFSALAEVTNAVPFATFPIGDAMTDAEAAAFLINYQTAHLALVPRGRLQAGETVLVLGGAGGVGTAAIQVAKALGAGQCDRGAPRREQARGDARRRCRPRRRRRRLHRRGQGARWRRRRRRSRSAATPSTTACAA